MGKWLIEHRKRERRCARTLKGRALLVIDHILTSGMSEDPLLCRLFRIAHCATGVCGNPHQGWVDEINATYKEISNHGQSNM